MFLEENLPGNDRVVRIVGAVCFALLVAALIVLNNSPATGYEASIYTSTPLIVWVMLIFTFICGLGITLHQLYTRNHEKNNLWFLGVGLIAASSLIVFSVHIFRGYAHMGGDVTTHLAYIQNIISGGHFDSQNVYPAMHVYLAQLSQILNIDPMPLILSLPVLFYVVFTLSIFLLARAILPDKGHAILATITGLVLPLNFVTLHTTPFNMSDMLMPFTFLICWKCLFQNPPRQTQFVLLLLLMIFLLPLFHPFTVVGLMLLLLTITLPGGAYDLLIRKKRPAGGEYRFAMLMGMILFIWGITWVSGLHVWRDTVLKIRDSIISGTSTGFGALKADIAYASGYGYSIVEHVFKVYSLLILYAVLTIISIPVILRKLSHNDKLRNLLAWCGPLAAYVITLGINYGPNFGFFLGRVTRYIMIIGAIFAGFISYEVLEKARQASGKGVWYKFGFGILTVALILCFVNVGLTTHSSRYILAPNDQITRTELRGLGWFINNKKVAVPSLFLSTQGYRLKYLTLPYAEAVQREDIPGWVPFPQPPYHFDYDTQNRLGESYGEDNYMVLNKMDRLLYTEVWPEIAQYRFYPQDFERLEQDPSVDRLYASNGLDIWYIHGQAKSSGQ
jgi:hypothetical protein